MMSLTFMFLAYCAVCIPISDAWWWQLPLLDKLRQGKPLVLWDKHEDEPFDFSLDTAPDNIKFLVIGDPKKGTTPINGRELRKNGPTRKIMKGQMNKLIKMTRNFGRPPGHPLRWG